MPRMKESSQDEADKERQRLSHPKTYMSSRSIMQRKTQIARRQTIRSSSTRRSAPWDRKQNFPEVCAWDYSEPEMLLKIMERHEDWAVVIALVGGGQEINDGEAGLSEWGRALTASGKRWIVYASPRGNCGRWRGCSGFKAVYTLTMMQYHGQK